MHILRWLMKHPIMLAWLLAIVAILLNFSVGSKQGEHEGKTVAAHDAPVQQVVEQAAAPAVEQVVVEQTVVPVVEQAAAPVVEQAAAPVVEQAAAPAVEQAVVPVVEQVAAPVVEQAAAPAVEQAVVPVVEQAVVPVVEQAAAPVVEQAAAPAVEQAVVPVVEQAAAPVVEQAAATTPEDLLRSAREAYWANELDRAVGLYTDLLKQTPDSLEYKGELANVYWKLGNAQQAATLFVEIAPQLAAQGRTTEALNMRLYVDMVNHELALKLDAALKQ